MYIFVNSLLSSTITTMLSSIQFILCLDKVEAAVFCFSFSATLATFILNSNSQKFSFFYLKKTCKFNHSARKHCDCDCANR